MLDQSATRSRKPAAGHRRRQMDAPARPWASSSAAAWAAATGRPHRRGARFPTSRSRTSRRSTAHGHAGQLVCGLLLEGVPVVVLEGRHARLRGLPARRRSPFPCACSSGSASRPAHRHQCLRRPRTRTIRTGDLMVIDDHINLLNGNPLIGINDERLGPRFPDMSAPYTPALIDLRRSKSPAAENFAAHRGVYVAVTGPNLETRAEYRFLRGHRRRRRGHVHGAGGDRGGPRGPSRSSGSRCITDMCLPDALEVADGREVPRRRPLRRAEIAGYHPGGRSSPRRPPLLTRRRDPRHAPP